MATPLTEEDARVIVTAATGLEVYELFHIPKDKSRMIYSLDRFPSNQYVFQIPWDDGFEGQLLRSSHIVLVSKEDGRILCDGTSVDEG